MKLVSALYFASLLLSFVWYQFDIYRDPFGYADISAADIYSGLFYFFLTFIFIYIGHGFLYAISPSVKRVNVTFEISSIRLLLALVFVGLLANFFMTVIPGVLVGEGLSIKDRVFADKYSMLKLLLMTVLAIKLARGSSSIYYWGSICIVSVIYVIVDVTREAIVPPAILIMFFLYNNGLFAIRKSIRLAPAIITLIFCVFYSMYSRDYSNYEYDFVSIMSIFGASLSYVFSVCFLHLTQVMTANPPADFGFPEFFLSITPLPSSWLEGGAELDGRNFDSFRPYGAAADLFSFSILAVFFVFALYGLAVRMVFNVSSNIMRAMLTGMLIMIWVWLFQYHLRTSFKFILLAIIVAWYFKPRGASRPNV